MTASRMSVREILPSPSTSSTFRACGIFSGSMKNSKSIGTMKFLHHGAHCVPTLPVVLDRNALKGLQDAAAKEILAGVASLRRPLSACIPARSLILSGLLHKATLRSHVCNSIVQYPHSANTRENHNDDYNC